MNKKEAKKITIGSIVSVKKTDELAKVTKKTTQNGKDYLISVITTEGKEVSFEHVDLKIENRNTPFEIKKPDDSKSSLETSESENNTENNANEVTDEDVSEEVSEPNIESENPDETNEKKTDEFTPKKMTRSQVRTKRFIEKTCKFTESEKEFTQEEYDSMEKLYKNLLVDTSAVIFPVENEEGIFCSKRVGSKEVILIKANNINRAKKTRNLIK